MELECRERTLVKQTSLDTPIEHNPKSLHYRVNGVPASCLGGLGHGLILVDVLILFLAHAVIEKCVLNLEEVLEVLKVCTGPLIKPYIPL